MAYKIEDIEGIGPSYAQKLAVVGIQTTADLLKQCASGPGRQSVAAKTGVSDALLLKWVNLADLMRIPGIGSEFSELLEGSGVDTVRELRNRNADNLAAKLKEVNRARRLTRMTPGPKSVAKWIQHARQLPPIITY